MSSTTSMENRMRVYLQDMHHLCMSYECVHVRNNVDDTCKNGSSLTFQHHALRVQQILAMQILDALILP